MIDDDRRKNPRVELMAQVQVTRDADVHILRARDVSRGGMFLSGSPDVYAEFVSGADLDVVLFGAGAEHGDDLGDVTARARIVRVVPSSADGRK
ncbi:MAG: PilZ domain-containing protein, partial [Myxococcota bacterium]